MEEIIESLLKLCRRPIDVIDQKLIWELEDNIFKWKDDISEEDLRYIISAASSISITTRYIDHFLYLCSISKKINGPLDIWMKNLPIDNDFKSYCKVLVENCNMYYNRAGIVNFLKMKGAVTDTNSEIIYFYIDSKQPYHYKDIKPEHRKYIRRFRVLLGSDETKDMLLYTPLNNIAGTTDTYGYVPEIIVRNTELIKVKEWRKN